MKELDKLPNTRNEAKFLGEKYYFTGNPCRRGHLAPNRTANFSCLECAKEERTTEKYRTRQRNFQRKFFATHREYYEEWYKNNSNYNSQYRETNREQILLADKEYYLRTKHLPNVRAQRNANTSKRRAQKLNATPPWLTKEDEQHIQALYEQAQTLTEETNISHVVDHIYPLQGETVSGLHCPENLQILTKEENSRKNNKHPELVEL